MIKMSVTQKLWMGTVSFQYRKRLIKILFYSALIVDFFLFLVVFPTYQSSEVFWLVISYISFALLIFFNSVFFGGILYVWRRKGPEFIVTTTELILRERSFWGRFLPTKSFSLEKINLLHIQECNYLDKFKNDFLFYCKSFDKLLEDWPDLEEDSPKYSFGAISSDFRFYAVEKPVELLTVFQSLIPLKKHPSLNGTYQRVE